MYYETALHVCGCVLCTCTYYGECGMWLVIACYICYVQRQMSKWQATGWEDELQRLHLVSLVRRGQDFVKKVCVCVSVCVPVIWEIHGVLPSGYDMFPVPFTNQHRVLVPLPGHWRRWSAVSLWAGLLLRGSSPTIAGTQHWLHLYRKHCLSGPRYGQPERERYVWWRSSRKKHIIIYYYIIAHGSATMMLVYSCKFEYYVWYTTTTT